MGIITNRFGIFKRRKKKKDAETYAYKPWRSPCDDCEFLFMCDGKIECTSLYDEFMRFIPPLGGCKKNYYFACKYMALTELYDRKLTDLRSPADPTEAFVLDPTARTASALYSQRLLKELPISSNELREERQRYRDYTAQMWIDEYNRLERENPCKYCEELDGEECNNCPKRRSKHE